VLRALRRAGFAEDRSSGSHRILLRPADGRRVVVPCHSGDLRVRTLASIVKQAGWTVEEFVDLLA